MITQTLRQVSAAPQGDLELEIGPVQAITEIAWIAQDGTLTTGDLAAFELISTGERAWIRPVQAWPRMAPRVDALRVSYVAGYGDAPCDVPADIRAAVKILAAHRFEIRDAVVIGTTATEIPMGVDRILAAHRIRSFG